MKEIIFSNENEKRHFVLPHGRGAYREVDTITQEEKEDGSYMFTFKTQLFPIPSK